MAKETKKEATKNVTETVFKADAESVETKLNSLMTATDELAEEAIKELNEEQQEDVKNETKRRIGYASHAHFDALITLKESRQREKIMLERLHRTEGLLCQLTGTPVANKDTIINGKAVEAGYKIKPEERLSYIQYDEARNEMERDLQKKQRELEEWRIKERTALKNSFLARYQWYNW